MLIGTLTVLETLTAVADLRLPSSVSKLEKEGIIDGTLAEMGLSDCKNTYVGNWLLRGISGETQSSVMKSRSSKFLGFDLQYYHAGFLVKV